MNNSIWFALLCISVILTVFFMFCKFDMRHKKGTFSFKDSLKKAELPIMSFKQGDRTLNFILDTGCSYCLINEKALETIDHKKTQYETETIGIDGIVHKTPITNLWFDYDGIRFTHFFVISNLEASVNELKEATGIEIDGLIGSAFFKKYNYILDYENCIAYPNKKL